MGKIVRKRKEFSGSSNSAENIMYDATKNVKEAIDEAKNEVSELNSNLLGELIYEGDGYVTNGTLSKSYTEFRYLKVIFVCGTSLYPTIDTKIIDTSLLSDYPYYQFFSAATPSYYDSCHIKFEDKSFTVREALTAEGWIKPYIKKIYGIK